MYSHPKSSILMKFIIIFTLFVPIPIFISGSLVYKNFENTLIENNKNKNLQLTEQIAKNIDENILRSIFTASSIINMTPVGDYSDIIQNVNKWDASKNDSQKLELTFQIDAELKNLFNYTTDLKGITFIFKNNDTYSYKSPSPVYSSQIKSSSWYKEMKANNESIKVLGRVKNSLYTLESDNGSYSIAIAALVNDWKYVKNDEVEVIYFIYSENTFKRLTSKMQLSRTGRIDIFSPDGESILPADVKTIDIQKQESLFAKDFGWADYYLDNTKMLITYYTVPSTNWKVVNTISYSELTNDIDKVMVSVIIAFIFIILLFVFIFFTSVSRTVLRPIKQLIHQMAYVEEGNIETRISVRGADEFAQLNTSFNNMVGEIYTLIKRIENEKNEKLNLEIQSLQYQINPHFLLNTLNSITIMAGIYGVDSIKEMAVALSKLLSNTLSKGGAFSTIEEEFKTLNSYAYIMKIRYGSRFDIEFDNESDVGKLYILKFLLQPIVENSILHGMGDDVFKKLEIRISAKRVDDILLIEVADNGVGISDEKLENLLESGDNKHKGFNEIGISNVNTRIKLNHGNEFGLSIKSSLGNWTLVTLTLPVITDDRMR